MSHATVVVIVADAASEESAIRTANKMMEPFDEGREVDPYPRALSERSIQNMREYFKMESASLEELAQRMPEWEDRPGFVDENGQLCYLSTYNPQSKWDWYELGGRWDGLYSESNVFPVEDMLNNENFPPFAILLPTGKWIERGEMGWWGLVKDDKGLDEWTTLARTALEPYRKCIGVAFDYHI